MSGNADFIDGVAAAHQAASGALTDVEGTIRTLKASRQFKVFRPHGAFLRRLADNCRRDNIRGIRSTLEGYREHLPSDWFTDGRILPAVLLGCRLIDDDERNILWVLITKRR